MLEIRTVGDEVLRRKSKSVKTVNSVIRRLLDEMAATMQHESGIGLAAPQVGIAKRVLVADVGDGLIELINPEILFAQGSQVGLEGCLSIPDVVGEVSRADSVRVTGLNRDGHQVWLEANGLTPISTQFGQVWYRISLPQFRWRCRFLTALPLWCR